MKLIKNCIQKNALLCFVFLNLFQVNCFAQINLKKTEIMKLPPQEQKKDQIDKISNALLPKTTAPESNSYKVLTEIGDNGLSYIWSESQFKNTRVGQVADQVEKKMTVQAQFIDSKQVSHSVNFKVQALQSLAMLEYTGWIKAQLNYNLKESASEAQLAQQISSHQNLIVSHISSRNQEQSQVSLQWNW